MLSGITLLQYNVYCFARTGGEAAQVNGRNGLYCELQSIQAAAIYQGFNKKPRNPEDNFFYYYWEKYSLDIVRNWVNFIVKEKELFLNTCNSRLFTMQRSKVINFFNLKRWMLEFSLSRTKFTKKKQLNKSRDDSRIVPLFNFVMITAVLSKRKTIMPLWQVNKYDLGCKILKI